MVSNNKFRAAAIIVLGAALAGGVQAKPDEVSEAQVKDCRFLDVVSGSSGYGKNTGWQAIAKAHAEQKAGSIGATHIVWKDLRSVGVFNGEASAKAYACR